MPGFLPRIERVISIAAASGTGQSRHPRRLRIILADDDRDQVLTLASLLAHEGHDVRGLYRGAELMQEISDFEPDVVIVDIKLPDSSGFEIAERIRQRYRERCPLLIAISGVFKKGVDKVLSDMVGFDHHLAKPFAFDVLLELIEPLALLPPREDLERGAADKTRLLLTRATELVGRDDLAAQLNVPASLLEQWIGGKARVPDRKLVALAELLVKRAAQK